MQPTVPIEKGSPTTKPCANSEMSGTADDQSAATHIKSADADDTPITAGPFPLTLVPQTLSAEIHAHGEGSPEISIRRTGQHAYTITLTKISPQGEKAGGADAA